MLFFTGGCGDAPSDPTPSAHFERVALELKPGAGPMPQVRTEQFFDVFAESGEWEFETVEPVATPVLPGQVEGGTLRFVRLKARPGEGALVARRAGVFDPARFSHLRVTAIVKGRGNFSASLSREGVVRARSDSRLLPWADAPTPFVFDLNLREGGAPFDELSFEFAGGHRVLGLVAVELIDRPPGSALPDAAGEPRLVDVANESRRAVGLTQSRPLSARFRVPTGGRLEVSLAESVGVTASSVVQLEIRDPSDPEAPRIERRHEPGGAPAWASEFFDLSRFEGREVELSLELIGQDAATSSWAVGDAVVWAADTQRPSVLLVTSDTHRADHLGAAGLGVDVNTPVLDALAARGATFDNCYSTTNVTNPSHIALLTGTHPRDTTILQNNQPLSSAALTLAKVFADAGYRTFAVQSAQHLAHDTSGLGSGFDRVSQSGIVTRDAEDSIDVLEGWLDDSDGQPRFVWLHLFDAHWPYEPPGRFDRAYYPAGRDPYDAEAYPDVSEHEPGHGLGKIRDMDFPRAQYRGEISYLDAQLERVFQRPEFRDGIISFVADHGESLGEDNMYFSHAALSPRELHIPLLLAWPDAPGGQRVGALVSQIDLGRTLLDLAQIDNESFPGRSLVDRLDDSSRRAEPHFAMAANGHAAAVRQGEMFLVMHLSTRTGSIEGVAHEIELYDLASDPASEHNIVEEHHDRAVQLRAGLVAWLKAANDMGWAGETIEDPALLQQLAELGYTQGAPERSGYWTDDDCEWCQRYEQ
ncbi:MAG: hypothetical protein DHS20C15_14970 [Planctomycetota bacterium]|nr:MAG: hypothetical protein DHS20C15_14970 [Planctomycetota bacterium]